jgi:hypothetical protein
MARTSWRTEVLVFVATAIVYVATVVLGFAALWHVAFGIWLPR